MGVVAAEAEVVDGGPARSVAVPGFGGGEHPEGRVGQERQRILGVQRRGRTPARIAARTLMAPAAPEAVIEWPRLDFSDPTGMSCSPVKIRAMLISSVRSPREVPVAWHSIREMSAGDRPAIW